MELRRCCCWFWRLTCYVAPCLGTPSGYTVTRFPHFIIYPFKLSCPHLFPHTGRQLMARPTQLALVKPWERYGACSRPMVPEPGQAVPTPDLISGPKEMAGLAGTSRRRSSLRRHQRRQRRQLPRRRRAIERKAAAAAALAAVSKGMPVPADEKGGAETTDRRRGSHS